MKKISLTTFEKNLKIATNISKINQALTAYLSGFAINTFSYTLYSYYPAAINKVKYDYCSKNYKTWHEYYLSEGYEDIDSTLKEVYHAMLPIFWRVDEQMQQANTHREKIMRIDSIQFGVEKGMSIPIHGPKEDFSVLMLAQRNGQDCLENAEEFQFEFLSAAYCYYHYLNKHLLKDNPLKIKSHLNSREIQCLTLIAKQYSTKAIAKELNITERTVHYHVQRLNNKLGTKNKYQSLVSAYQKGWLKLVTP